jgi:hypothetical protein
MKHILTILILTSTLAMGQAKDIAPDIAPKLAAGGGRGCLYYWPVQLSRDKQALWDSELIKRDVSRLYDVESERRQFYWSHLAAFASGVAVIESDPNSDVEIGSLALSRLLFIGGAELMAMYDPDSAKGVYKMFKWLNIGGTAANVITLIDNQ